MDIIIIGGERSGKHFKHDLAMRLVECLYIPYQEAYSKVSDFISMLNATPAESFQQKRLEFMSILEEAEIAQKIVDPLEDDPPFNFMFNNPPTQKKNRLHIPDKRAINRKKRKKSKR